MSRLGLDLLVFHIIKNMAGLGFLAKWGNYRKHHFTYYHLLSPLWLKPFYHHYKLIPIATRVHVTYMISSVWISMLSGKDWGQEKIKSLKKRPDLWCVWKEKGSLLSSYLRDLSPWIDRRRLVCPDSFRTCLPAFPLCSYRREYTKQEHYRPEKLWMAFAFHVESDNKHGANHKVEAAIWIWQGRKGGDNGDENGPLVGH